MSNKTATPSYEEITKVVHNFYKKVMLNERLSPFFEQIGDFSEHEKRIAGFWWSSMGGKLDSPQKIDMIGKHFPLGITDDDLHAWLSLFSETLEENLSDDKGRYWMDKVLIIAARLKQIVINNQAMGVPIK